MDSMPLETPERGEKTTSPVEAPAEVSASTTTTEITLRGGAAARGRRAREAVEENIISMAPIDLDEIQSKVVVRKIRLEDFEALVVLQGRCFPGMPPWQRAEIESQLKIFPDGQFCVEYDGQIVASCSSLIVDDEELEEGASWQQISSGGYITNHDPYGDMLYGIEIMVDPEYRGMKLARRLYDARKRLCEERNLKGIIIGGRIPGYVNHRDSMTAREYVEKVMQRSLFDPVLTIQLANGFNLKKLVRSYLEDDQDSSGYATLLEWPNLDWNPEPAKRTDTKSRARVCLVQYQMREIEGLKKFQQHCEYFIDAASNYKSDFVVFPEIFSIQLLSSIKERNPAKAVRKLARHTPQILEMFSELAVQFDVNIVGGSHLTLEEHSLYNVAYLFRRDGSIGKQYKLHISPSEHHWWGVSPGNTIEVFDTDAGKIAIVLCYDVEFPEVCRIAVEKGADIIFVPFCTDERYGYLRVRYCAQARAIENQVYVAIAGTVGNLPSVENMDVQYAQSAIFTPSDFAFPRDAIASEATPNIETVLVHDIDLQLLSRHRRLGKGLNWKDRRTDLYEITLKK